MWISQSLANLSLSQLIQCICGLKKSCQDSAKRNGRFAIFLRFCEIKSFIQATWHVSI